MRIKKIILKGFKSYKSQEKFDEFHPRTNVIVGKNGTGKSNLIVAIRFLLSSEFQKLRTEERKSLLYKSADNIVSGYVEIHFDNSDKRFPIDSTEVRLRRNIGLTKSDYYLNGRHMPSEDVMNLLESAGFSRSNPYYIVQQGKVQALARMKTSERLELLYEVAGTRVYDERKQESLRIMEDSKSRKKKIDEVLVFLDERLSELETEKEELKGYQELDKTRRVVEYTINMKELNDINKRIDKLDESHEKDIKEMGGLHKRSKEIYDQIKMYEKDMKTLSLKLEQINKDKEFSLEELTACDKNKARLDLILGNSEATMSDTTKRRDDCRKELADLQKQIKKANKALQKISPNYLDSHKEEQKVKESILSHERRLQELYTKQGWAVQFSSSKERDAWIKKEIKSIKNVIDTKRNQVANLQNEIKRIEQAIELEKEHIEKRSQVVDDHKLRRDKLNERYNKLKEERDECFNKRKELWRNEAVLDSDISHQKSILDKAERQLYSTIDLEQAKGLDAIKRIKKEQNIQGVYAPIIELFTCTDNEMTAVEVAAKSALFYVVVDTDETASKMVNILNNEKAGRVAFMPLNKLIVREPTYPRTETAVPMIDRLKFNNTYRKAFLQIFGRTLICSTLEEASGIAKTLNMDCITADGDKINRKGALTGGYYDTKLSRLALMKTIKNTRDNLLELEEKLKKIKSRITSIESISDRVVGEIQELEQSRTKERDEYETFHREATSAQKKLLSLESQKLEREQLLSDLEMSIRQLEESHNSLSGELGTKLLSKLTSNEQKELHKLNSELTDLKKNEAELRKKRSELEAEKNIHEMKLTNHLLPRMEELEKELSSYEISEEDVNLDRTRSEAEESNENKRKVEAEYNRINQQIVNTSNEIEELQNSIEKLREQESEENKKLQSESKNIEKILNNRGLLTSRKEEIQRKLRDIGSLPAKSLKKYEDAPLSELVNLLQETKLKLKSYSDVNKKALDQFTHFNEQREALETKKQELDEGEKAIYDLIRALDEKKNAAISLILKMVASYFTQVFTTLTSGEGTGQLVMQKQGAHETEIEEIVEGQPLSLNYKGADLRVSFTKTGTLQRLHQLSGGQQSLVALALIIAIQRSDPAPFYIFDEIDSALDDTYRLSVAKMINEQSKNIQFILTTHRPELVQHSHKQYLIEYKNKTSNIVPCDKQEALELLEGEPEESKDVGEKEHIEEEEIADFD